MKKLYILLVLLFPFLGMSQVNMWTYDTANGGNNNGVIETNEFQKSVDEQTNLIVDPATTITVTTTVRIDQNMINTIDFNGSTITRTGTVAWMLDIDKRAYTNTLTTIKNLIVDGNDKSGSAIDISSRVHLQNVEIKDIISNNANGIRNLIYNLPGCYGQWVFDNVDIHDLEPIGNNGQYGDDLGAAHGFISAVQQIPTQPVQVVYKNSSLHSIWGEDAGAITVFSAGLDISNTPVSFWFENIHVADAQRRAVKGFAGNQTWINSTFTSATYDNPNIIRTMPSAGLFVIGPGSSSTGATNNVICGCTFQGHPSDPFDSFYTRVIMTGDLGPSGLKISNSTFTGANPQSHPDNGFTAFGPNLKYLSIDNSTFGTQNGIRLVGNFADYAYMSTNNTYVDGQTTTFSRTTVSYTQPTIAYADCPTIGGITDPGDPDPPTVTLTDLLFESTNDMFVNFPENTTNPTATMLPYPNDPTQTYTYEIIPRGGNDDAPMFRIVNGNQLSLNNGGTFTPDYETKLDYNANNIYACDVEVTASPSGLKFKKDVAFYITNIEDEGGEVPVISIAFVKGDQTVNKGIQIDTTYILNNGESTPDNTTVYIVSSNTDIISDEGLAISSGKATLTVVSDDLTNGTIEDIITVNVNGGNGVGNKRFLKLN